VFLLEFSVQATHGHWVIGGLLVVIQYACLRCLLWLLRWGLAWAHRGVSWCVDGVKAAARTWWQAHWRSS
jgi:hypothetical protein